MASESDTTVDLEDSDIDLDDNEVGEAPNDDAVHVVSRCVGSWVRGVVARGRVIAVLVALLLSAGMVAGLYVGQYRVDERTSAAAVAAVSAASEGSVALLSYAPATLDHDLAAAQSHLTGEFLTYYRDFVNQIVGPAAKQKDVHATASVVRAAPAEVHADTARVLIFLNQATTSRDNPDPVQSATSVMVGLTNVEHHWLISSFDPM
jgi:Mce-associated membrane protein